MYMLVYLFENKLKHLEQCLNDNLGIHKKSGEWTVGNHIQWISL